MQLHADKYKLDYIRVINIGKLGTQFLAWLSS